MKKLLFVISLLCVGVQQIAAQGTTDTSKLHFPIYDYYDYTDKKNSPINLDDPKNVNTNIVYNPETGLYEIYQTIGGINYRYPTAMTLDEYVAYKREEALKAGWIDKVNQENDLEHGNNPIPALKMKGEAFDIIFGGDEINIRPQGSAQLSFGVNISKYDNPVLPIKQRRVTTFDFQQQINLNLVGQIGDKLKLTIAQNTEATFNFQNQVKIEYTGYEDEIIQKIEAGNVSLPLKTTLIQGSQSLFGIRSDLRWGRFTTNLILAQEKGKRQEINVSGGAQVQDYEVKVDNYEANKHYFLNYFHREHFDSAMQTMPLVQSGVQISKIEVWVTNRINKVENTRNILAFTDLGEEKSAYTEGNVSQFQGTLPDNDANDLYGVLSGAAQIRDFSSAVPFLSAYPGAPGPFNQSQHYEKVENARQLSDQEFTYSAQLGYISLKSPLNQDEVLGVAYQYTYAGRTYQVGEFSNDVPVQEGSKSALILKLLKPTIVNPANKTWDLMMKNVYSIGAYQVSQNDFILDLFYNNPKTSVDINYLPYEGVNDKLLMQQLSLDRLNIQNNVQPDGRFDYVPIQYDGNRAINGGTIDPRTGRVYFSTIEPFGKTLRKKLESSTLAPSQIDGIVFEELYDSTKTAAQQLPNKNRFKLMGEYKSSVSSDISLNSLNVPEGSVTVTAGGVKLTEGTDYTVDYNLGRVKILNQGILESGTPIKVQLESNSLFGFQQKSLVGAHFNYEFNKDFNWGATVMNLTEKPLTQKVNIGDEPISNTVIGTDISYRKEVPFLTKMVDMLPIISTKEKSSITAYGEFAYLIPGTQRAISKEGISYIDGFEGSQSAIDIKTFGAWKIASVPQGQSTMFPEAATKTGLYSGFNRAKLSWYVVDPTTFYQNSSVTPDHLSNNSEVACDSRWHILSQTALFPQQQPQVGTLNNIPVLDLAYYPNERGPYNYDTTSSNIAPDGTFNNPEDRWAGIMRSLTTTNFETANIQFIQFWMLDPFNNDATQNGTVNTSGGDLYFNLGNISEDILPDSRKSFENGLPASSTFDPDDYDTTDWAVVYNQQVIVNAFDNNINSRRFQDVGLDGLDNAAEAAWFSSFVTWINSSGLTADAKARLLADPSSDNYQYYLDPEHDADSNNVVRRYKNFNGMEGNSPTSEMSDSITNGAGYTVQATTVPDIEDLNQDNNLSETESYFQYHVSLRPQDLQVGQNFITNSQVVEYCDSTLTETWYQFKIPIEEFEGKINGISDFRSIRFIRMFVNEFDHPVVVRFAKLELIRGEWRKYLYDINEPGETVQDDPNSTEFNIAAVNLEENESKDPVGYWTPPGIIREQDQGSINLRQLNEQSISLQVCGLKDGEARAAYKNVTFDIRSYKKLKMFVHAEQQKRDGWVETDLKDDQLTCFIRLGTDFENNYYEYEIPLKLTAWGTTPGSALNADQIWPELNNMEVVFDSLVKMKIERNKIGIPSEQEYIKLLTNSLGVVTRIKVKGNPNLQGLRTIMIGVRNPDKDTDHPWMDAEDGLEKCAEVWVNELRLTDFDQKGGWASTARVNVQLADFASVNLAGNYSTPNWGSIEKKVSERQRDTQKSFDFSTNVELGQFFGRKIKLLLPFYYGYSASAIDPQYDLLAPDVLIAQLEGDLKSERVKMSRDLTVRKSYNFTNVRRERPAGKEVHFWDLENLTATYSYNELYRRDLNTEYDRTRTWRGALGYIYSGKPLEIEPFKNVKAFKKSPWLRIIKDVNFNLGPKSFSMNNDMTRLYNERQNRNLADSLAPQFAPTVLKNFSWNRTYDLKYDFTKQLKFTFNANNSAIILEPEGPIHRNDEDEWISNNYNNFIDSLKSAFNGKNGSDRIGFGGYNMNYGHAYDISYKLPLNKIPITDWISTNVKLRGSYDWQRAPLSLPEYGNTIQNSRNFSVNGQLNFLNLYNKIDYLKRINTNAKNNRGGRNNPVQKEDPNKLKIEEDRKAKQDAKDKIDWPENPTDEFLEKKKMTRKEYKKARKKYFKKKKKDEKKNKPKREVTPVEKTIGRAIMALQNVSFNYTETDGMLLPGFVGETNVLGMGNNLGKFGAPSLAFVSGAQNKDLFGRPTKAWGGGSDFAEWAADTILHPNDWLVRFPGLNLQHTVTHSQAINGRIQLEPLKDLSISLTVDRKYNQNDNSFFRYNDSLPTPNWEHQNPVSGGSLNFTTITWKTAFTRINDTLYTDRIFADMRNYRQTVSTQLGTEAGTTVGADGFYDGYGANQQDVLIGSFLAAYTGRGSNTKFFDIFKAIPLPNWDIRYDGLAKFDFMKKYVRNFTLKHAYRSTVSLTNFSTNLAAFDENGIQQRDASNNFIAPNQISGLTITEQFAPFLGVDATWIVGKNGLITSFEFKRDRSLAMNVPNMQITEMRGREWVIGAGYKFSKVKLPFQFMGERPESDLNMRFDLSIRNNISVSRNIIENTNQATSGQNMYSVKFRVDYNIGPNLNVAYYFDRVVNTPVLSNAYPTANTSTGISLRFNLAQ